MTEYRWQHTEPLALTRQASALARAKSGDWVSHVEAVADLRWLVAWSFVLSHELGTPQVQPVVTQPTWGTVDVQLAPADEKDTGHNAGDLFDRKERASAAAALLRSWYILGNLGPDGKPRGVDAFWTRVATVGGLPAVEDAGIPPAAVVVVKIAGVAALATVACYLGQKASEVLDRELGRRAQAQALARAHATALEVLQKHVEREREEKRTLPLSEAERAVLAQLDGAQQTLARDLRYEPLPSVFSGAGGAGFFGGAGIGIGLVAAAAVAVFALSED